jgi:hypothetical protein
LAGLAGLKRCGDPANFLAELKCPAPVAANASKMLASAKVVTCSDSARRSCC